MRGVAGATRATRFGRIKDYAKRAHEELCVLVQVETKPALDQLEAICAVRTAWTACSSGPPTCTRRWATRARRLRERTPPPDTTGEEAKYLLRLKDAKTRVTVVLNDGETVSGWVEYYDRDMVKINREPEAGPNVFIRKVHVRYIYED